ncbi:MAG: hypothetical protein IT480_14540 [Gammaproteobacteria bacterium]|nr:hypothetical protein [Gammaproteobacteria bacterium]
MKAASLIALTAVLAAPAYADCVAPTNQVTVPDGSKATLEEMLAAKKAVNEYNTAVEAFNSCLNLEQDAAIAARGKNLTDEERKSIDKQYAERSNSEVTRLQAVADELNAQIRAYKAAHPSK